MEESSCNTLDLSSYTGSIRKKFKRRLLEAGVVRKRGRSF